jgi:hypothetical protein
MRAMTAANDGDLHNDSLLNLGFTLTGAFLKKKNRTLCPASLTLANERKLLK